MNEATKRPPARFPFWGMIAIPAGLLWGTALGAGAGLGVGIGFTVFAAAIVIASGKL